jgi:hypothetical protein
MAVNVQCSGPQELLEAIREGIKDGTVETWLVDSDGDFTHSPEQWKNTAWLRPRVVDTGIVFNILAPVDTHMSREVYAIYHGRFVEMLLAHFDLKFVRASATALPAKGDRVNTTA